MSKRLSGTFRKTLIGMGDFLDAISRARTGMFCVWQPDSHRYVKSTEAFPQIYMATPTVALGNQATR